MYHSSLVEGDEQLYHPKSQTCVEYLHACAAYFYEIGSGLVSEIQLFACLFY